jgi:hypothetical protein
MPAGRPTTYDKEVAIELCSRLSQGISLRTVCEADEMPALSTFYQWLAANPEFTEQYAQAKYNSSDALVEQLHSIADDQSIDPQHKKYMLDIRKWTASKLKAKKYGDRQTLNHEGNINYTDMTEEELDRKIKALEQATNTSL